MDGLCGQIKDHARFLLYRRSTSRKIYAVLDIGRSSLRGVGLCRGKAGAVQGPYRSRSAQQMQE